MSDHGYKTSNTTPPDPIRDASQDLRAAADQARATAGQVAGQVSQQANNAYQQAKQTAGEVAGQVSQEASAVVSTLKEQGAEVVGAVQARAADLAEQGKRSGAEQAEGFAKAIHRAADELESTSPQLASMVHDAAGSLDRVASGLRNSSPSELLEGVTDFARRNPLAFFGVTVLAGFALARFARASAPRPQYRPNPYGGYGDYDQPRGYRDDQPHSGRNMHGYGAAPASTATGAPGWMQDEAGTARPATLASATLGGAAAMQSGNQSNAPLGSTPGTPV